MVTVFLTQYSGEIDVFILCNSRERKLVTCILDFTAQHMSLAIIPQSRKLNILALDLSLFAGLNIINQPV